MSHLLYQQRANMFVKRYIFSMYVKLEISSGERFYSLLCLKAIQDMFSKYPSLSWHSDSCPF